MIDLNSIQLNNTVFSTEVGNSRKTSKETSNDFSTILKSSSVNSGNNMVKNKDTSIDKAKNETLKDNDGSKTSADENLSGKKVELNEKVKSHLKKVGFSEEDIENLEENLSKEDISQNALMYLINILFKSENNSTDNLNLQGNNDEFIEQISNKISSEILQNLNYIAASNKEQNTDVISNDVISKIIKQNVSDLSDILEQFGTSQEFNDKLIEKLNTSILAKLSLEGSIYDKVKSGINTALSKELNLSNPQEESGIVINDSKKSSKDALNNFISDLREAGFSEEDIKNLKENLSKGKISQNTLMYLTNILLKDENISADNLSLQGNNDEFIEQISNKISSEILQNLNYIAVGSKKQNTDVVSSDVISKIIKQNVSDLSDILEQFGISQEFNDKLIEKLNTNILAKLSLEGSMYDKVKSEINTALKKELNLGTHQEENINNLSVPGLQGQYASNKIDGDNTVLPMSSQEISNNNGSGNSEEKNTQSSMGNGTAKSEESILQKIIEGGSEDKISKVTNFMAYFKNLDTNNSVQDLGEMVINKNSFNSDVIKTLKYMDINNVKELTVKINPKELGEITINLTMQEGKLKAVLTASNKEAYNLLNANLQDLSNKIQTNDIKIQGLSLNIYNEDATFFRDESGKDQQQGSGQQNKNSTLNNIVEDEQGTQNDYYYNNNVNILA